MLPSLALLLRASDLVVELGVVEGQADVGPELSNESLVLLSRTDRRDLEFSKLPG